MGTADCLLPAIVVSLQRLWSNTLSAVLLVNVAAVVYDVFSVSGTKNLAAVPGRAYIYIYTYIYVYIYMQVELFFLNPNTRGTLSATAMVA